MTTLREAAQQALEALENGKRVRAGEGGTKFQIPLEDNAITSLRAALAQQDEPVQKPVAWLIDYEDGEREVRFVAGTRGIQRTPLYTAPPQRKPQALDEAMSLPRAMAQAYENGYKAGAAHEREACARVCEHQPHWVACAAAIRARGEQP